jgi:hypothetical protein
MFLGYLSRVLWYAIECDMICHHMLYIHARQFLEAFCPVDCLQWMPVHNNSELLQLIWSQVFLALLWTWLALQPGIDWLQIFSLTATLHVLTSFTCYHLMFTRSRHLAFSLHVLTSSRSHDLAILPFPCFRSFSLAPPCYMYPLISPTRPFWGIGGVGRKGWRKSYCKLNEDQQPIENSGCKSL